MSYDSARKSLQRLRSEAITAPEQSAELVDALNHLVNALESDMVQIKMALSYVAHALERDRVM